MREELQNYLGLINFCKSFLANLSVHLQTLHFLLRDSQQCAWKEQDVAFQRRKGLITKAPVLVHFDPTKHVVLAVDVSPYSAAAVLAHRDEYGQERPKYSAAVPERAEVFTLEHAYADALSRSAVSQATSQDPDLSQVVKAVSRGEELFLWVYSHKAVELSLQQGCLLWGSRVVTHKRPWSRLHVDFGGPFKAHCLLVVVGAFWNWVEVLPVSTASRGTEYKAWLVKKGIRLMMGLPYHPASNGADERLVDTVKDKLKKNQEGNFWTQVARVLFQYRTKTHDVTGRARCELLLGHMVKAPLKVLHPHRPTIQNAPETGPRGKGTPTTLGLASEPSLHHRLPFQKSSLQESTNGYTSRCQRSTADLEGGERCPLCRCKVRRHSQSLPLQTLRTE
ncbi:uncharacterized protein LOC142591356 [Dermacentor variabilis]|uniref:uncharacterized protein LOC142591356 n=1 Tax=Dermacentor variabilis TaxID=34621 RepID=UPI003F5BF30A